MISDGGQRRFGHRGRLQRSHGTPARVLGKHHNASRIGLAERDIPACDGNPPRRALTVRCRRHGLEPASGSAAPVQQPRAFQREDVGDPGTVHDHRDFVGHFSAADVAPRDRPVATDAHPTPAVLHSDDDRAVRCHDHRGRTDMGHSLEHRWRSEVDPSVLPSLGIVLPPQQHPPGRLRLHDQHEPARAVGGHCGRARCRDESSSAQLSLAEEQPTTSHVRPHRSPRTVDGGPRARPAPARTHAAQPRRVGIAHADHRIVRRVGGEVPALLGHDARRKVRRCVRDVVVAVVQDVDRHAARVVAPQRRSGEMRRGDVVRMVVARPLRLVPGVRLRVLGAKHGGSEPRVQLREHGYECTAVVGRWPPHR
ncbi:hypothetical protein A8924_5603 [Saccharopolyspora erythraea NRRL 2338]|nr:hypothetical protein A8924_5603 [Saccharopolyspora erythraea NRRL 2338]